MSLSPPFHSSIKRSRLFEGTKGLFLGILGNDFFRNREKNEIPFFSFFFVIRNIGNGVRGWEARARGGEPGGFEKIQRCETVRSQDKIIN